MDYAGIILRIIGSEKNDRSSWCVAINGFFRTSFGSLLAASCITFMRIIGAIKKIIGELKGIIGKTFKNKRIE